MSEAVSTPDSGAQAGGSSILDAGGGAPADWRSGLPEDIRGAPALKDIRDVGSLAKSYLHAASMVGADKADLLRIPREGDIPAEVWNRLGRPEAPDGYGLKIDAVPAEVLGSFSQIAHAAGLTKGQAEKVAGFYAESLAATSAAREAEQAKAYEANIATLRREWGPSYDDNIHAMKRGVEQFGGAALVEKFAAAGLANDPDVVKMFAKIGAMMGEANGLKGGGQGTMGGPVTPEQARAEWASVQRDSDFMAKYMAGDGPAVARARALFDAMTPRAA